MGQKWKDWGKPLIKKFNDPDVQIIVAPELYQKMHAYAICSKGEIGGFAKTKTVRSGNKITITVLDVRIFKQVVNPVHTELDREALADLYYGLIKDGEDPSQWNLWWHSHHDFAVFYSGTDDNTIEALSKDSTVYSLVINKAGDLIGRSDRRGNSIDAKVTVSHPVDETIMAACKKEVEEKVTYSTMWDRAEFKSLKKYGAYYEHMGAEAGEFKDSPGTVPHAGSEGIAFRRTQWDGNVYPREEYFD